MAQGKQVWNATRQVVLVENVEVADTYWTRLKGLMGRALLPTGVGLWIVPCSDIHSCFMRFEFDAVFVDKQNTVLYVLERMKPWRISKLVRGGHAVLELPGGTVAATGTQVGDQIERR